MNKLKVGLVCLMVDNFDGGKVQNFSNAVTALGKHAEEHDYEFCFYPEFVMTYDDAEKAQKVLLMEKLDFLMIQSTTFPDGEALIKLAKCCKRIGLWGLPEASYEGSNFIHSNNSFCGINMGASIIRNYLKALDIKYKWFFGHPKDKLFIKRYDITIKALNVIKKIASSKVALVGGIAPGFNDFYYDERLATARLGIETNRGHEFSEIRDRAYSYSDTELAVMAEEFTNPKCCTKDVTKEDLIAAARYYRAYKEFAEENNYDALAISCWPQIKGETLACSIIGKLNQNGIPAACEGDLPGAVSMLMLHYLTGKPGTLMDMCAFDEEDETVLMWHCGPSPEYYADDGGLKTTCSYQPNLAGETLRYGLINKMRFKPGPVTFMRLTGEWDTLFLLDGKSVDYAKDSADGSGGWIGSLRLNRSSIGVLDFANTVLVQGFQHHYPMMEGDLTEELMELSAWLGLKEFKKVSYENYLQNST